MTDTARFVSRELDERACRALGGDVEKRSVFEVATSLRVPIHCDDISEQINRIAADPDDPDARADAHDIADVVDRIDSELITLVELPRGHLYVGLGDIGTCANPVYGIICNEHASNSDRQQLANQMREALEAVSHYHDRYRDRVGAADVWANELHRQVESALETDKRVRAALE